MKTTDRLIVVGIAVAMAWGTLTLSAQVANPGAGATPAGAPQPTQPVGTVPPTPIPAQGPAPGATGAPPVPATNPNAQANERIKSLVSLPRGNADYRLGPGDLVEIGVFGVEDFRHTVRINASGIIKLPLIDPVMASGLTSSELEQKLTSLLETDVIKNPQVSVFVKEYRSQPVYVLGAVARPGQYQITLQLRVVDVIAMAGGLQGNAGDEVLIQRPLQDGGEKTISVDLAKVLESGDLALNVVVQGGDVVHIKERPTETVYVLGDVNRAGAFIKPPKQPLRVSQLIAWAGGPMKTASLSKGQLVRFSESGERQMLPVDFAEILKGKKEDFLVQAKDVIFIPGSTMKSLGYGVLNTIPATLAAIPYAVIP
jgi:polysaccharide export outer membrane protein